MTDRLIRTPCQSTGSPPEGGSPLAVKTLPAVTTNKIIVAGFGVALNAHNCKSAQNLGRYRREKLRQRLTIETEQNDAML